MLVRLFVEMGTLDQAHGAAAALVLIGKADPEERALYQQYRPNGVVRAHARLTEEVWQKQVYHPDEDWALSQILATLSPAVANARARLFKETGLKKKQRRDVASDPSIAVQGVRLRRRGAGRPDAGGLPGPGPPRRRRRRQRAWHDDGGGARADRVGPGQRGGRDALGRRAGLRRGADAGGAAPGSSAALADLRSDAGGAGDRGARGDPAGEPPERRSRRAGRARRPVHDVPRTDVDAPARRAAHRSRCGVTWRRPPAPTSVAGRVRPASSTIRAGFLLAGDLEVAARLGQAACPAIEPSDIVRDLCSWGVSDGYFELRAQLGLRTVNLGFRG